MKTKFLIIGGAGFIGTNLAECLIEAGHSVVVADDLSAGDNSARLPKEVDFHKLDVRDTKELTDVCSGVDVIVHLAALPRVEFSIQHPQEAHDVNVNGTLSVLEAARSAGVKRVVFAASSAAYGDQQNLPLSLGLSVQPKSPYALHKYMGEQMMKLWSQIYGIETVSLRFFNVYGSHMDPHGAYALVIGRFLNLAVEGKPLTITGDGEQTRDFVHVKDVAEAIIKASAIETVGKGEVFNIGSGAETTVNEVAKLIGGDIEYVAARLEPKRSVADITETKNRLDWEATISLEEGITSLKHEVGLKD